MELRGEDRVIDNTGKLRNGISQKISHYEDGIFE